MYRAANPLPGRYRHNVPLPWAESQRRDR